MTDVKPTPTQGRYLAYIQAYTEGFGYPPAESEIAINLMKEGTYQVECSDEGLMTDDIQDCLSPVIQAVQSTDDKAAAKWAFEMLLADRVGFICVRELKELAGQA